MVHRTLPVGPYALWPSTNTTILAVQDRPSSRACEAHQQVPGGHQKLCSSGAGRCLASLSAPTSAKTSSELCLAGTPRRQHWCGRGLRAEQHELARNTQGCKGRHPAYEAQGRVERSHQGCGHSRLCEGPPGATRILALKQV